MADLELDFAELRRLRATVDRVASTFSRAEKVSHEVAGYTGHDDLADKVRDFADNWDISRNKLRENLKWVSEALDAIIETFGELESGLARAFDERSTTGGDPR